MFLIMTQNTLFKNYSKIQWNKFLFFHVSNKYSTKIIKLNNLFCNIKSIFKNITLLDRKLKMKECLK